METEQPNLCHCRCCHYTFNAAVVSHNKHDIPKRCPDCGKQIWRSPAGTHLAAVAKATDEQVAEYYKTQAELLEELWFLTGVGEEVR